MPLGRFLRGLPRILGLGPIRTIRAVVATYGSAGGSLLGAGLAFGAIFALVPITLLVVGLSGFVVADPAVRAGAVREIAARVPALEEVFTLALEQVAAGAAGLSALALVGLLWTASQFYGQLDGAFSVIFRNAPQRGLLQRTLRGLVTLAVATVAFSALVLASLAATTDLPGLATLEPLVKVGSPVVSLVAVVGIVLIVYRYVPNRHVPWGIAGLPAVVAGVAEAALSTLFVALAPHLASPRLFGPFVTVFATLAWLSWSFQALLLGAAWVRVRLVEEGGGEAGAR